MDKSNFPIVYYRMPHQIEAWFIQSESKPVVLDSLKNVPPKSGYIIYPFNPDGDCKVYFIQADKHVCKTPEELEADVSSSYNNWIIKDSLALNIMSKSKDAYCNMVTSAVNEIKAGSLQKVVLSRTESIENTSHNNPVKVFQKLCTKYPSAFVSLVYIPDELLWITTTPELLVSEHRNKIKTVSLAGTKPFDSDEEWGAKEKKEQDVVTEYIQEILKKYCENIMVSFPEEVIAGNLKHLITHFSATLKTDVWTLVSSLHPTPAVCGMPLNEAKKFILETEGYHRKYYSGFLGPCNVDGNIDLFVNLRCAEIFSNAINLYIGGGITKDSIPEKEWEETEMKKKTLLYAFE